MITQFDPQAAIITLLEEEQRLCTRLLAVAEAQRDALIAQDVDTLPALVREMEGIGGIVEQLEAGRIQEMERFTGSQEEATLPLRAVLARFAEPSRARAEQLRESLSDVIQRLHAINVGNAALARHALHITEQQAHLLRTTAPVTYSTDGVQPTSDTSWRAWWA
jgi:hypothetical protein